MLRSKTIRFALLIPLLILVAASTWEFALEPLVGPHWFVGHQPYGLYERLEVVAIAVGAGFLSVGMLLPFAMRASAERSAAKTQLALSEARLRQAVELIGLGYWVWDALSDRPLFCSEECARIHGMSVAAYLSGAATLDQEFAMVHADDRAWVKARYLALREGEEIELSYRLINPSGSVRHVRERARPQRDSQGRVILELGTIQDITTLKQAEEKLVQAQKMEAVGQLTGGVAHDFNNALGIVLGNLELACEQARSDDQLDLLVTAIRAANRAAVLTSRLLAFSRQQTLMPEPTDVANLAGEMAEMLRRSLGVGIAVEIKAEPGLEPCLIDRHQLESALVNLAINARDAMAGSGKLLIECANARIDDEYAAAQIEFDPGDYVQLAVSDNGCGMAPAVAERAFEPFYTTKEVGRGSGLGLSMVHGFVKQSGGHVTIYSEEGRGTTVKLYLPRAGAKAAGSGEAGDPAEPPFGQSQRILVVEDDADLRVLVVNLLQQLRYDVIEAGSGASALRSLETRSDINLLLSDVILPGGMNGRELAAEARRLHPGLPVLFMSGYTGNAIADKVGLETDLMLIQKPFRKLDLAHAMRQALEPRPEWSAALDGEELDVGSSAA